VRLETGRKKNSQEEARDSHLLNSGMTGEPPPRRSDLRNREEDSDNANCLVNQVVPGHTIRDLDLFHRPGHRQLGSGKVAGRHQSVSTARGTARVRYMSRPHIFRCSSSPWLLSLTMSSTPHVIDQVVGAVGVLSTLALLASRWDRLTTNHAVQQAVAGCIYLLILMLPLIKPNSYSSRHRTAIIVAAKCVCLLLPTCRMQVRLNQQPTGNLAGDIVNAAVGGRFLRRGLCRDGQAGMARQVPIACATNPYSASAGLRLLGAAVAGLLLAPWTLWLLLQAGLLAAIANLEADCNSPVRAEPISPYLLDSSLLHLLLWQA
jgi:hypothetical protein